MSETINNVITMEYLYSGVIPEADMKSYAKRLFELAHRYEGKRLQHECEEYLITTIDSNNIHSLMEFSTTYTLTKLKCKCMAFLAQDVSVSVEFQQMLEKLKPDKVCDVVCYEAGYNMDNIAEFHANK